MTDGQTDPAATTNRRWYHRLGPGLITACVVIGPGSILTSSQTGAAFGFAMSWIVLLAVVFMLVYMQMGARLGVVAARSPGKLIAERAGRWLSVLIGLGVFFISASFQFGNNLGVDSAFKEYVDFDYMIVLFNALAIGFLFAFRNLYRAVERLMMCFVGLMLVSFTLNLSFALSLMPSVQEQFEQSRRSPFTDVNLGGSDPRVEYDGAWYELVSIDGLSAGEILRSAGKGSGGSAEDRFGLDLVRLMQDLRQPPGETVQLVLREEENGVVRTIDAAPVTHENWHALARALNPVWDISLLGLAGTTFVITAAFYQSYLVQQKGWGRAEMEDGLIDARIGAVIMALITLMIMSTAAAVLRGQRLEKVEEVADQLAPLFGSLGRPIFCVGLFSAAYSSFLVNSMIGGFILADGLGLGSRPRDPAPRLFTTAVLLTGMGVALFVKKTGVRPVPAIVAAQAVTVIASPLMAGALWWLTNRRDVMGDDRNGPVANMLAALGFVLLLAMAGYMAVFKVWPAISG